MTLGYDTFSTNEEHKRSGKKIRITFYKIKFYGHIVSLAELDSRPIA